MKRAKIVLVVITISILVTSYAVAVDQSICNSSATITLHPNGTLKSCMLRDSYEANGIRCKMGQISFYDDGKLEECVLAEKATVDGVTCNDSSPITFYPSGKLKSCVK